MLKILHARFQQYMNHEDPDVQIEFRKGRGTRDQVANICWIIKKARVPKKIYFSFIDYTKALDFVDHNKLWKIHLLFLILKEIGIPDHHTCLMRNLYAGQEATELDMEQQTSYKSGKEYDKAVYCHPACLTYMQSTSCEMPGLIKHKLETSLLGEM